MIGWGDGGMVGEFDTSSYLCGSHSLQLKVGDQRAPDF